MSIDKIKVNSKSKYAWVQASVLDAKMLQLISSKNYLLSTELAQHSTPNTKLLRRCGVPTTNAMEAVCIISGLAVCWTLETRLTSPQKPIAGSIIPVVWGAKHSGISIRALREILSKNILSLCVCVFVSFWALYQFYFPQCRLKLGSLKSMIPCLAPSQLQGRNEYPHRKGVEGYGGEF